MTRFLLDTNIVSNLVKPQRSFSLVAWLAGQSSANLFISAMTIAEVSRGILERPPGRKRDVLDAWFSGPDGPRAVFGGQILPFDEHAALIWATLMAEGKTTGRPRSGFDTIIAAVALANDCTVVTDNERDFEGVPLVNPMRTSQA